MTNNIESRIEELKEQAQRRDIGQKAYLVARELGESDDSIFGVGANERRSKTFTSGNLTVYFGSDCDVSIEYRDENVFYQNSDCKIKSYKTGYWERLLNKFYRQAQETSKVRQAEESRKSKEESERKLREEARRFGLGY